MKPLITNRRILEGAHPAAQVRETRTLRSDMIRIMETLNYM
jgi:hypothetical protein